ncbi:MAG: hypothetical protein RSB67_03200 [Clostridia bacterium]
MNYTKEFSFEEEVKLGNELYHLMKRFSVSQILKEKELSVLEMQAFLLKYISTLTKEEKIEIFWDISYHREFPIFYRKDSTCPYSGEQLYLMSQIFEEVDIARKSAISMYSMTRRIIEYVETLEEANEIFDTLACKSNLQYFVLARKYATSRNESEFYRLHSELKGAEVKIIKRIYLFSEYLKNVNEKTKECKQHNDEDLNDEKKNIYRSSIRATVKKICY